jgi:hypothetical protein
VETCGWCISSSSTVQVTANQAQDARSKSGCCCDNGTIGHKEISNFFCRSRIPTAMVSESQLTRTAAEIGRLPFPLGLSQSP